jgi:hypothetical protein
MRLTTDYSAIFRDIERAHDRSVDAVLSEHRSSVPRRSGEYAGSLERSGSGLSAVIGSPLRRAPAMRFGANVGPRRGPHHGPVDTFDGARAYVERMPRELRSA